MEVAEGQLLPGDEHKYYLTQAVDLIYMFVITNLHASLIELINGASCVMECRNECCLC